MGMIMKMYFPEEISLFQFIPLCIIMNVLYGCICFFTITLFSTISGNHAWYQDQSIAWLTAYKIALSGILTGMVAFIDTLVLESVDIIHWRYTKKISFRIPTGHAIYRCALIIAVNTFMTAFIYYFITGLYP